MWCYKYSKICQIVCSRLRGKEYQGRFRHALWLVLATIMLLTLSDPSKPAHTYHSYNVPLNNIQITNLIYLL